MKSILREVNLVKKIIKRENIFHRYSLRGKSFQTGIVSVVMYSHPLPRLSINCSKIVNTNRPIKIDLIFICYVLKIIKIKTKKNV